MKINNIEFRKSFPLGNKKDYYYEIVEWFESGTCCTLLRWEMCEEQPDIRFVGSRPFSYEDKETLWKLMEYGQDVIQAEYKLKDMY